MRPEAQVVRPREDVHASVATTRGVRVEVRPSILASHTDPDERRWVFVYRVRISNEGSVPVRLLARRWEIIDAHGRGETVEGEGVVGEQPMLEPGGSFEYESFCPLGTAWGTMEGAYLMEDARGDRFEAEVARFYLVSPRDLATV